MTDMLKRDMAYLNYSPSELESFLLSKDTIRVLPNFALSAGGILLAQKRLAAAGLDREVATASQEIETIRGQWKTAWSMKCHAELKMRMRQWGDFLLGMAPDKTEPTTAFKHQVRSRVIMQLIEDTIPAEAKEFSESIERKDKILAKFSVDNDFIWEPEVQSAFPREKFWYLYRVMKYEKEQK